jgi:outer membrane protein OmpA-like peptidoglycan-associated protein
VDSTVEHVKAVQRRIEQVNLRFARNSTQLLPGQEETLRELGQALHTLSLIVSGLGQSLHIELLGQTDDSGSDEKNARLSQERADYVRVSLVAQGLPGVYFTAVGLGAREALLQSHEGTEQERAAFRKVSCRVVLSPVNGK